jgi:hypothetical protein
MPTMMATSNATRGMFLDLTRTTVLQKVRWGYKRSNVSAGLRSTLRCKYAE